MLSVVLPPWRCVYTHFIVPQRLGRAPSRRAAVRAAAVAILGFVCRVTPRAAIRTQVCIGKSHPPLLARWFCRRCCAGYLLRDLCTCVLYYMCIYLRSPCSSCSERALALMLCWERNESSLKQSCVFPAASSAVDDSQTATNPVGQIVSVSVLLVVVVVVSTCCTHMIHGG